MANKIMIDILPVALLLLFLFGMRVEKPLTSLNTGGYLSLETGKCYRGLFSVVIVFHHLAQWTEAGIVFRYFTRVGYLAVAFFFFLSGYGLQKSFIRKRYEYSKGFLLKRIPSVLFPWITIMFFCWLMYRIEGQCFSWKDMIASIIDGSSTVSYFWYIINILIFYIVYWVLMLVCKSHDSFMILGGTVWYFLYVFFCIKMNCGSWWYNASQLLIVGMFWAVYECKILDFLKKWYVIVAPVTGIVFLVLFLFREKIAAVTHIPSKALTFLSPIFFVFSLIMFSLKTHIGNKILNFLGDISLEIYISQGLFIMSLRSSRIYIADELLWCLAVLMGTIAFSCILHIVLQGMMGKYRQLLSKL